MRDGRGPSVKLDAEKRTKLDSALLRRRTDESNVEIAARVGVSEKTVGRGIPRLATAGSGLLADTERRLQSWWVEEIGG
jgi:transposase